MASARNLSPRIVLSAFLVALSLIWSDAPRAQDKEPLPDYVIKEFGNPPAIPDGPLSDALRSAVKTAFIDSMANERWGKNQSAALDRIVEGKDPRIVWLIADLMRFASSRNLNDELSYAAAKLLEIGSPVDNHWGTVTDHLIAWDVPAPPDYLRVKRAIFTGLVPGWDKIFVEGDIDWRHVSWGGVLIDDRKYDTTDEPCNCIPAADNPKVSSAGDATWLKDGDIVFGIGVNGEYRAYPRRIMEVREMVNDTLGGMAPGHSLLHALRFSAGLLHRPAARGDRAAHPAHVGAADPSNKVMYDVKTFSVFDTFLGTAVTGPLAEKKLRLKQATVVTTDWGRWKKLHPGTTVLVEELALGRDFDFRNGRDANGPIFPVGDVDPRLPVHEDIIGVVTASGKPVAFQRSKAFLALKKGDEIAFENVRLQLEAGGIKAVGADGSDLGSHQAFWFAWSQFHPGTALWPM